MSDPPVKVQIVTEHGQRVLVSYEAARAIIAEHLRSGYVVLVDSPGQIALAPLTSPRQLPADATDVWLLGSQGPRPPVS